MVLVLSDPQARRELREKLGLSRMQLAAFLVLSEATIVRWEQPGADAPPRGLSGLLLLDLEEVASRDEALARELVLRASRGDLRGAVVGVLTEAGKQRASREA